MSHMCPLSNKECPTMRFTYGAFGSLSSTNMRNTSIQPAQNARLFADLFTTTASPFFSLPSLSSHHFDATLLRQHHRNRHNIIFSFCGHNLKIVAPFNMQQIIISRISLATRRAQLLARRPSAFSRQFSVASSASSGYKNSSYDVAEHHRREVLEALQSDETFRNSMAYSLAMATSEGSKFPSLTDEISPRMKDQLERSKTQLSSSTIFKTRQPIDDRSLPKTLEDALRHSSRAIVVTDVRRPFRVRDVNKAWENLCGYSYLEAKDKSLGQLLAGEETDELAVSALLNQLMQGEDATAVLTNYTKTGRKFRNRLHAGPLFDEDGNITNFVGVLQEVEM